MIVRMARVVAIGPKEDLMGFLALIRRRGILHIDDRPPDQVKGEEIRARLKTLHLDRKILSRRLFFAELRDRINQLLNLLPPAPARRPFLNPENIADSIAETVDRHLQQCRSWRDRREELRHRLEELGRFNEFLTAIAGIIPEGMDNSSLDHIGVEIRDAPAMAALEELGAKVTGGRFELATATTENRKLVGIITTEKEFIEKIRAALANQQVHDYALPSELAGRTFSEQRATARRLLPLYEGERESLAAKLAVFSKRWRGVYLLVLDWLDEQLALINASASLFETEMCFVISGWLPLAELFTLNRLIETEFGGRVIVEEKELREEDLAHVPTMLKNRGYFAPFELLARLLPVPGYGSFDITPFIGLFFPIFFGMMLGDMGYGALLLLTALILVKGVRNKIVRDVGKIFGVAAVYTIIFGWLFGEFFGVLGNRLFDLEPLLLDRHQELMPMFYFALAVGFVHILVGLVLGAITSFRYQQKKETLIKLTGIAIMLGLALLIGASLSPALSHLQRPLLLVLLAAIMLVLLSGGLLAPLELLKHVGNIISYARIMAIGLTSVLLAHVANNMVGAMGSVWLGVLAGILLHGFNIVLGIFAPTIHALRLHYVEFFSKIVGDDGREYKPLAKTEARGGNDEPKVVEAINRENPSTLVTSGTAGTSTGGSPWKE
jgi:V/A-type H+-transporting ATPase subunit I